MQAQKVKKIAPDKSAVAFNLPRFVDNRLAQVSPAESVQRDVMETLALTDDTTGNLVVLAVYTEFASIFPGNNSISVARAVKGALHESLFLPIHPVQWMPIEEPEMDPLLERLTRRFCALLENEGVTVTATQAAQVAGVFANRTLSFE